MESETEESVDAPRLAGLADAVVQNQWEVRISTRAWPTEPHRDTGTCSHTRAHTRHAPYTHAHLHAGFCFPLASSWFGHGFY